MALHELPEKDKDAITPIFKLRPWVSSNTLGSSIKRLTNAFGSRPAYLALSDREFVKTRRVVHDQLDALRDPSHGFRAWVKFLQQPECEHFIPTAQLSNPGQYDQQLESLYSLDRGLCIILEEEAFPFAKLIASRTAKATKMGAGVLFVVDFGKETSAFIEKASSVHAIISSILDEVPHANIALSASSFPDGFVDLDSQEIFERYLFEEIVSSYAGKLIYSDRGSGRAVRQLGGAGQPAPRIDFATGTRWYFFREKSGDRVAAYQRQAIRAMNSPNWESRLRLWGTQLIERTAIGDPDAITSPPRAVAARINIHLHQQLYYGDPNGLLNTDEEWTE